MKAGSPFAATARDVEYGCVDWFDYAAGQESALAPRDMQVTSGPVLAGPALRFEGSPALHRPVTIMRGPAQACACRTSESSTASSTAAPSGGRLMR